MTNPETVSTEETMQDDIRISREIMNNQLVNLDNPELRQEFSDQIWARQHWPYVLVGFIFGLIAYPGVMPLIGNPVAALENLAPEAFGILITVGLIGRLAETREKQQAEQELKDQLIRNAGSKSNAIAIDALHQLSKRNWIQNQRSLLREADLRGADWRNAELWQANLDRAHLPWADLSSAYVYRCSVKNVDLQHAKLQRADLRGSDLSGTNMHHADLNGAIISGTSVYGSYREAKFDEYTTLPDGSKWPPEVDWDSFGVIQDYRSPQSRTSPYE